MKMYVFMPYDGSFKVSYLTNAVGTNDRLMIHEIKSEVNGIITPGLCAAAKALNLPHDYLETTHTALIAIAVAKSLTLKTYADRTAEVVLNTALGSGYSFLTFTIPTATNIVISDTTPGNDEVGYITMDIPNGTNVTALVATFTKSTAATVKIGAAAQTSGATANNFTSPKTYRVTAENTLRYRDYVVTVNVLAQ